MPMNVFHRASHVRDPRFLLSIVTECRPQISRSLRLPQTPSPSCRGVKTKTRKSLLDIEELQQGAIGKAPLPKVEAEDELQYPSYPTVLQGVRDNVARFRNCVILTRVGNFYELYFNQAEEFGPAMNLKLAYRSSPRHPPVAMAGFPFWQLDRYLKMLVLEHNQRVAIAEEIPNKRIDGQLQSGGNLFDRQVVRVVTPGTLIDEQFIDPAQNNYLLSVYVMQDTDGDGSASITTSSRIGLAWIDLTTGDFWTASAPRALLSSSIARIAAREIVLQEGLPEGLQQEIQALLSHHHDLATYHTCSTSFSSLSTWHDVFESPISDSVESSLSLSEQYAIHQLIDYTKEQLQRTQLRLQPPRQRNDAHVLSIDRHSLRGLEVLETSKDGLGKGSLFHAVRKTVTKSGSRLLRDRLVSPSASLTEINRRLDLVSTFLLSRLCREELVQRLKKTADVQRIVQRFTLNKGDADDMLSLAKAIGETAAVHDRLQTAAQKGEISTPADSAAGPIQNLLESFDLQGPLALANSITTSIDEEGLMQMHRQEEDEAAEVAAAAIEVVQTEGFDTTMIQKNARIKARIAEGRFTDSDMLEAWVMKRTASEAIGQLHTTLEALKTERELLEQSLQRELKAPSLTLKWAPGKGYTCHIKSTTAYDRAALEKLKAHMISSTKTTRSFYLPEWSKLGGRIDAARARIRSEEQRIFVRLREQLIGNLVKLRRNAAVMDEIDVATAFASLAQDEGWTRPVLDDSTDHQIIGGRHPTVKLGLEEQGRTFVSNDCVLDSNENIWLITGPNMAGKSTFLRQNALITILAQVGSFVPAQYARIGIVDQIFSRIGAADDLFRDQSTFMVEMLETAAILQSATPRSFAILDEVGRGTTPQDGIAVAFGILSHLYEINQCRSLFATHFHRLADMTEQWKRIGRYCTDILEDESGGFIFQHQLKPGVNRQSHALKIAKLANLPVPALQAAQAMLEQMQQEDRKTLPIPVPIREELVASA
jgi:DNA mismatch repair ATPase MutS